MTDLDDVMRPHLAAMWADGERLVQKVTRAVTAKVPSYAHTPSSEVWIGMTRILERVAHGNPFDEPGEEDRHAAYGTGAQGARAGIVAGDLVAAILLGASEVEADVMARAAAAGVDAETRLEAATRARRWAEQVAVWATHSLLAASRGDSDRHVLEDHFVRGIQGGVSPAAIHEQAAALGVDPHREWCAVLALSHGTQDPSAVAALRLAAPGALWSAVVEEADGPTLLADAGSALIEAARAARAARRFALSGVHDLSDLGLLVPLHEDHDLAARLVRRWVEPLEEPARHELAPTLRNWLAHDGQVDLVAREFGVHANTVRNRLARIDAALGATWRTAAARSAIWAALQIVPDKVVRTSTT